MTTILLTMPKLSPTMEEGVIAKWHKKEGDTVEVGDLLMEVATDKATVEHTAIDSGFIRKIIVPEGKTATVNELIAIMTEEKDASFEIPEKKTPQAPPKMEEKKEVEPTSESKTEKKERVIQKGQERVFASPLAKKLAKQKGLDLSQITGSGPRGRIMSRDLEGANKGRGSGGGSYREEALSPMRKSIGKHMQDAKRTIPHFYISIEVDAEPLFAFRKRLETIEKKVTFNDCIVKACAHSLIKHPEINVGCSQDGSKLLIFPTVDIAVAVSVPGGLITPIIKEADQLTLFALSEEVVRLRELANKGRLQEDDYRGGSFTISNLGMYGVSSFQAIVNPPQAAILAVGAILDRPVVKNGQIIPGKTLDLTLSVDHRAIDGQQAAIFLKTLKSFLEEPLLLLT